VLTDKNAAKKYQDHEVWLLEKNKVPAESFENRKVNN
jgi:hypothetical protein